MYHPELTPKPYEFILSTSDFWNDTYWTTFSLILFSLGSTYVPATLEVNGI
jgi:hypothetical protein